MTDKLDMTSPDMVSQNIEKIASLFPNCVTESANGLAIDFDQLKQELSKDIVEGNKERYRLEWPGKREAIVTANLPINKTLRPAREESVDFDNTENLYIEGDNLEVLKLLQESYLGKIKMIYIDPPYNTGKDFVYKDNFNKDSDLELFESGQKDEYNNRLVANPDTSGRYHSDWLTMMYPRLKLARNLLTDDGVIFISIDDNEVTNLCKICDEIFSEVNYIATFPWKKRTTKSDVPFGVSQDYEWVVAYSKGSFFGGLGFERKYYKSDDYPNDRWRLSDLTTQKVEADRPNSAFDLINPKNQKVYKYNPNRLWGITKDTFQDYYDKGKIVFPDDYDFLSISIPSYRVFECEDKKKALLKYGSEDPIKSVSTLFPKEVGMNEDGNKEIISLFGRKVFSYPKPTSLLKHLLSIINMKDGYVLDMFSGSASLADSIFQFNFENSSNLKFILVQLPEIIDEKTEAFNAGYNNICEIGKDRIRRAAERIKEKKKSENEKSNKELDFGNEIKFEIDYGFRVYKLDSSNMQDVYYAPNQYEQGQLDLLSDNIKPDRTSDDLVAQIMLDWGLPLSLKIEKTKIANKEVFKVADDALLCCFDEGIDEAFAKEIATLKPLRIVFRDKSFKDDTAKENVKQLLKQLSPDSEMKVI
jgi:adenine-specific DNA-methyltransferase